jgi:hypothetical protein
MIEFPETAQREWQIVADAHNATNELRLRIERDTRVESEVEHLRIRHQAALEFQQELEAGDTPVLEMMTLHDYRNSPVSMAPTDSI